VIEREQSRLRNFIRKRVADRGDAEDILQEVFAELLEAYRLMKPVEQVGAWLFRVARNRITDLFRKKKPDASTSDPMGFSPDGESLLLEDLLPSPEADQRRPTPAVCCWRNGCRAGRAARRAARRFCRA